VEGLPANRGIGIRSSRLVCVECGDAAHGQAWGWRIYRDVEGDELITYCPGCAKREFGQDFVLPFFPDGS